MRVKAIVITGFGFNSDIELAEAFRRAGAEATRVHITDLIESPSIIHEYSILGIPGGFSFGDHLGSGKEIANLIRRFVGVEFKAFISQGKLAIGICNGFQVITKLGIVPNLSGSWDTEVSLIHNEGGRFIDTWVPLSFPSSPCVWTKDLAPREMPIRHGEGRFFAPEGVLRELEDRKLVALRYDGKNPNGSLGSIAGITDPSGRILGLMPHPECFLYPENHPRWRREKIRQTGIEIFEKGVEYCRGVL